MTVDVGIVVLPTDPWAVAARQWRWVEDAGFAAAYTYDHLQWGGFPDGPWHAATAVLAAASVVTARIRLGTLVASPNFRHPVALAREVITLDDLSGGRLDLGIGAGSPGPDSRILGQPACSPAERLERFAEFVDLLDRLLTAPGHSGSGGSGSGGSGSGGSGSAVSMAGRYYSARDVPTAPGCVQVPRVPFTVAAAGGGALALAARHGQRWVTTGAVDTAPAPLLDAVRAQSSRLDAACGRVGRDPASIGRVLLVMDRTPPASADAFDEYAGPFEAAGITEVVLHHPGQTGPFGGDPAVFEEIAARHA